LIGTLPLFAEEYLLRVMMQYSLCSRVEILGHEICMGKLVDLLDNVYLYESVIDLYVKRLKLDTQSEYYLLQPWEIVEHGNISEAKKETIDRAQIIIPVCRNLHWILAVVNKRVKMITIYDSLRMNHKRRHYRK
jgi:hypothetical protein